MKGLILLDWFKSTYYLTLSAYHLKLALIVILSFGGITPQQKAVIHPPALH